MSFYSEVKKKLKEEVEGIRATIPTFKPGLAILQVVLLRVFGDARNIEF